MSKPAPAFQGAAIESAGKDSNKIRRHDLQAAGKKFQQHDSHGNQSQNNSGGYRQSFHIILQSGIKYPPNLFNPDVQVFKRILDSPFKTSNAKKERQYYKCHSRERGNPFRRRRSELFSCNLFQDFLPYRISFIN
jgi:hypothetical protein